MGDIGENEPKRGNSPLLVVLGFSFRFACRFCVPKLATVFFEGEGEGGGIVGSSRSRLLVAMVQDLRNISPLDLLNRHHVCFRSGSTA